MNPYEHMLSLLRRYHSRGGDGERLGNEMLISGYNVVKDFVGLGVGAPWVWTPSMEEFYKQSDSFVYELLVWHHTPGRVKYRAEVNRRIGRLLPEGGRILCLGDGIGYDSYSMASSNPSIEEIVSFEFESHSSDFAKKMFEDAELVDRVKIVNQLSELEGAKFELILCFDVLEHVPDPPAMIQEIASYLTYGGHAFISEAFSEVEPTRPTHLLSNLKYAGRTVPMFEQNGFFLWEEFCGKIFHFSKQKPPRPWKKNRYRALNGRISGLLTAYKWRSGASQVRLLDAIIGEASNGGLCAP
jgi:SAM-dependent methyltransferase